MNISAEEFSTLKDVEKILIIDVREKMEYHSFNVGGINIPLAQLLPVIEEMDLEKDSPIIVICQRGLRSKTAQQILISAGFKDVKNLSGGLIEWNKRSLG